MLAAGRWTVERARAYARSTVVFDPPAPSAHADELAALRRRIRARELALVLVPRLAVVDRDPARVMALLRECEEWGVHLEVRGGPLRAVPTRCLLGHLRRRLMKGLPVDG
jgi:hypothetical protein